MTTAARAGLDAKATKRSSPRLVLPDPGPPVIAAYPKGTLSEETDHLSCLML